MAKQRLGRGFEILMPKDLDSSILEEDKNRVQKLLISDILPNPEQPRRNFDDSSLQELVKSIKRHGILQPLIVVNHQGKYRIVAGERRWRAAQAAKLSHVPAIVRSLKELEQLEIALIENIQRVDLNPLEQAMAIYRLQQQFGLALEQIARRLGKAPSSISNTSRLLQLPEAAKRALSKGEISEGHARAILTLKQDPQKQTELLRLTLANRWTVRQAEQFALAAKKGASHTAARQRTRSATPLTEKLSKQLGLVVRLRHTARGGQLIIDFKTTHQLKRLAELLGGALSRGNNKKS